jgi:catechol 2,3-dioxygenase-like lactoylglutathione lyase family enzyme
MVAGMTCTVMRVARPTNDVEALLPFYCEGIGMRVLSQFRDHDGFDGVMVGLDAAPYHVEFTKAHGEQAAGSPSPEHLLVFYYPEHDQWSAVVDRLRALGFEPVRSSNPYWDRSGMTFEDPDGYRTVVQHGAWPLHGALASGDDRS